MTDTQIAKPQKERLCLEESAYFRVIATRTFQEFTQDFLRYPSDQIQAFLRCDLPILECLEGVSLEGFLDNVFTSFQA